MFQVHTQRGPSIFLLLVWLLSIVGTSIFVETPSQTTILAGVAAQESNGDSFAFNRKEFRTDPEKGFSVAFKLLNKAKREKASPETLARLHCEAAKMYRDIALDRHAIKPDLSRSATILRSVITRPDHYLTNVDSARQFANCVCLLAKVYDEQGTDSSEIYELLDSALTSIDATPTISDRAKYLFRVNLRLTGGEIAHRRSDFPAAIEWVRPLSEISDKFLEDDDDAGWLVMIVGRMGRYLAKNKNYEESMEVIDSACEKLEQSPNLSDASKICWQCAARGIHLYELVRGDEITLVNSASKKCHELAKAAQTYSGPEQARVVGSRIRYLDRYVIWRYVDNDLDQAIVLIHETMKAIELEPELQQNKYRAIDSLREMIRNLPDSNPGNPDPRLVEIRSEVGKFIARFDTD